MFIQSFNGFNTCGRLTFKTISMCVQGPSAKGLLSLISRYLYGLREI